MTDTHWGVLVVEDNPGDVDLIRDYLEDAETPSEVTDVARLADAVAQLGADSPPDVVLLDLGLIDSQGLGTLRRVLEVANDVPVLVLTGSDDRELAVNAMREGARDYLVKGALTPDLLSRALAAAIDRSVQERRQREIEEALRQSEARFRSAFLTAPHGMALVALDGRFLRVNSALCELLDLTEPDLLATDMASVTFPKDLDADRFQKGELLEGRARSYQIEKRYVRNDGEPVWALLSVSLVRAQDGEPVHFVSQIFDLTERKDLEQRLLQSQKMESVGQLTGGMAHDFNNLLGVITGNLELLQRSQQLEERDQRRLSAALDAAGRGAELTRQLLAFSRRQALDVEVIDTNALLDGIAGMLRRTLGEDIELEIAAAPDLWNTKTDPNQLEAAILNLALNARDAMPGGGRLTVETANVQLNADYTSREVELEPGDYVMIAVSDTGTGIAPAILDKVFEPFFTTKEVGRGTGLGLSMVFGFAKQSGGHVKIYSEQEHGTTLKLYLPRGDGPTTVAVPPDYGPADNGATAGATILVVDDREDLREVTVAMLEEIGYRVLAAGSGPAALALVEQDPTIALLLSDVVMPGGMTGPDLARAARSVRPELPVLFMSGYAESAMLRENHLGGSYDFISKPFHQDELIRKICTILAGRSPDTTDA